MIAVQPSLQPAMGYAHRRFVTLGAIALAIGLLAAKPAHADRCQPNASGAMVCTYQERAQSFPSAGLLGCRGSKATRSVRWQVPEGTPPAGGWPVVFFYQGTVPASDPAYTPFTITGTAFGAQYFQASLHELLDDPAGTGKRYAVIAPEAAATTGLRFWDTNKLGTYSLKDDACFFPQLFKDVSGGAYGAPSPFNMNKRFAYGISSGGYNTSRMAVTFNQDSNWAALAIVSASYATCAGPLCSVPSVLPANHPPTKFYHGTADVIVPISTMRTFFDRLSQQGIETEKVENSGGHAFTADVLGPTGIKAWFDRH